MEGARHDKKDVLIWMAAWGWFTVVLLVGSIVFLACEGVGLRRDKRGKGG
jgi:hypothetical protein